MLIQATKKDLEKIIQYVKAFPSENIFILGDLDDYGLDHDFQQVYLEIKDEQINCVYLRFYDSLVIYSEGNEVDIQSGMKLINALKPNVINGLKRVIDLFNPSLILEYDEELCYFCKLKHKDQLETDLDCCIFASIEDATSISEGTMQIEEFTKHGSNLETEIKKTIKKFETNKSINVVIKQEGKIIAHGNTACESKTSGLIGGVYTLPGYRGKGYASKIVSSICLDLLARNKEACLFYNNPLAGSIYHRLGFVTFDQWVMLSKRKKSN